jgi:predicted ATPase/class 3 adenylate cyclase
MGTQLPSETFTFLFTDLVGSTRLWERHSTAMSAALARHDEILHAAISSHRGSVVKSTGDGVHAVFADAESAVRAAAEAQRMLGTEPWEVPEPLKVRMGLNTGAAERRNGDYFGTAVNRAARLMAIAHGGQVLLSNVTMELSRDGLPVEFEMVDLGEHRMRDLSRIEHVFQLRADGLQRTFPSLASLAVAQTNLPTQITTFVGRGDELKELAKLLEHARLVSLVGPGGCGKTRLALEVGTDALDRFRDGIWFVDLAGVRDADLVAQTVAVTLGRKEQVGRSYIETLMSHLSERETLIVLDNCEQAVEACAALTNALLRTCPAVQIITTSREPLGVQGEFIWRVPSLSVPANDTPVALELIHDFEALQLFFDRAERARPGFPTTEAVVAVVAEICRQVDGIPLAIELAAARVRVLSVEDVLTGLSDQLHLLAGGPRTVVSRHQTMAASISWSYELLSRTEQLLFRRTSVFHGGFDLAAAEYVCSTGAIGAHDVFDLLGALVDRSLVVMDDEGGSARFRLLETIRQFGDDQLSQSHEAGVLRTRHLEHFVALAERAAPLLEGHTQRDWMDRLEIDHSNLRAALGWSLREDVESGLRLATALHYFWYVRGHYSEGAQWFELLFQEDAAIAPKVRADALYGDSYLSGWGLGHFDAIIPHLEESLALARQVGDPRAAGRALWALGAVLTSQQPAMASAALEEAVDLARQTDDTWCLCQSLTFLGTARFNSEGRTRAFANFDEALTVGKRGGHVGVLLGTFGASGTAALAVGDYETAQRRLGDCLALARELGHRIWIVSSLGGMASLAVHRGDYDEAQRIAEEAHAVARASDNPLLVMGARGTLGLCALARGDPHTAAQHYEEAINVAQGVGAPPYMAAHLATVAEVRLALADHDGAQAAIDDGRELAHASRPLTQAQLLNLQGRVARARGELVEASASLHEALQLFEYVGDEQGRADTLEDLAGLAVDRYDFELAAELFGAGQALRDHIGYARLPHREEARDFDAHCAGNALDPSDFAAAFARGAKSV